ncbi:Synaptic vesicle glycoprotein 2B [Intoshia linei]|uniref:Synaptic vesicle glycoprotein 2B n=1 Tax=Intoshia linei TaxID=1819745 RepID=A0A177B7B7_9BILA|nr:Synaptic vesicle glycoprotein 2B [Intoshia linei]
MFKKRNSSETQLLTVASNSQYAGQPITDKNSDKNTYGAIPNANPNNQHPFTTDGFNDEISFNEVLSTVNERALSAIGFGRLHCFIFIAIGLVLISESVEIFLISFIVPSAEQELCMTESVKGGLAVSGFAGMLLGGLFWTPLSDRKGRKNVLLLSITTSLIFSVIAAFVKDYNTFVFLRFLTGIGIGGSIPISYSYFIEMTTSKHRGLKVGLLLLFWAIGGVYISSIAYIIIPQKHINIYVFGNYYNYMMSSWRIFLIACIIPSIFAISTILFIPESPRLLLQLGDDVQALNIYNKMYKTSGNIGDITNSVPIVNLLKYGNHMNKKSIKTNNTKEWIILNINLFLNQFRQILEKPLLRKTIIIIGIWCSTCFGYYGMNIWFPEWLKLTQYSSLTRNLTLINNEYIYLKNITGSFNNTIIRDSYLMKINFHNLMMDHILFERCTFLGCNFENITSYKSYLINSTFYNTTFKNTDFYSYKLVNNFELMNINIKNSNFKNSNNSIYFTGNYIVQNHTLSKRFIDNNIKTESMDSDLKEKINDIIYSISQNYSNSTNFNVLNHKNISAYPTFQNKNLIDLSTTKNDKNFTNIEPDMKSLKVLLRFLNQYQNYENQKNSTFTKDYNALSQKYEHMVNNSSDDPNIIIVGFDSIDYTYCNIDFEYFDSHSIFFQSLVGQITQLFGCIVCAFVLEVSPRSKIIGVSLATSGISTVLLWAANTSTATATINAIFNFLIVGAYNTIDLVTVETFPTNLRSSGFGLTSSFGRLSAILANLIFSQLINYTRMTVVIICATALIFGSLLSTQLDDSKKNII